MPYVVTDNCKTSKWTDCVEVCPADCFYELDDMLVIDPEECVECDKCVPVCPVGAIYPAEEVPEELSQWIDFNETESARLVEEGAEPIIAKNEEPYPGAEERKKALGF